MTQTDELQELKQRVAAVERKLDDMQAHESRPRQRLGNPWARICGMLADEPLYDDWRKSMEDYRDEIDQAAQS